MSEENKTNVEYMREWFRACPALSENRRFRVDYLSDAPTEYALYASPSTITFHENIMGEEVPDDIQSLNFIFASKEVYGADVSQNLANLGFFDAVVAWIIEQNSARNLPRINEGTVKSIKPTLTAFAAQVGSGSAKYQIQIKLTYRRSDSNAKD